MIKAFLLGVLLTFGVMATLWKTGRIPASPQPGASPLSVKGDTCAGKKFCVVAYLAPWCPYCKAEVSSIQRMIEKSQTGEVGIRVVVGMERAPGQNAQMANGIAKDILLDTNLAISNKYGIHAIPAFVVTDQNGEKVMDGQQGRQWTADRIGG
jgi:thiol-disulfide isomerase/thioredoxin